MLTTVVIFRLGEERCALERAAVSEIALVPELSRPPGMPSSLEGFLNLGGEAVPVVDAARLFGVRSAGDVDPLYRHVLIVQEGGALLGLLVDRVEDVRTIDPATMRPADADDTLGGAVLGQVDAGGQETHLLAAGRILLAAEKARLAELSRDEQRRLDAMAAQ